jgi:hypothetical protein
LTLIGDAGSIFRGTRSFDTRSFEGVDGVAGASGSGTRKRRIGAALCGSVMAMGVGAGVFVSMSAGDEGAAPPTGTTGKTTGYQTIVCESPPVSNDQFQTSSEYAVRAAPGEPIPSGCYAT